MKRSIIRGQLVFYDAVKKVLQLRDHENDQILTTAIRPETFPNWVDWTKYIGKELVVRIGDGKLERIALAEKKQKKVPAHRKKNADRYLIDQPGFKRQMKDLVLHIGITLDTFDFGMTGPMDYLIAGLYVMWYPDVEETHSTGLWLDVDCFHDLPAEERGRIMEFLEYCAESRAIVYWRDSCRFTWCVINRDAYQECCKEFGFRSDFCGGNIASEAGEMR